jgi:hypothetical protein
LGTTGWRWNVTFPAHQYGINGERCSVALLGPIAEMNAPNRVRDLLLEAYGEYEEHGSTAFNA